MNNIIDKVLTSNNIVLLCHNNPDGDAIGSTLAMYHALKKLDKESCLTFPLNPSEVSVTFSRYLSSKVKLKNCSGIT